ncbi:MAG: hypothetical protein EOO75_21320, partial [Myxococcales bacterium]
AGAALGWLVGGVLRVRRREVEGRLARAGVADPARTAGAMYASLGAGLVELLWTVAPGRRPLGDRVRLTERAERALASLGGRGAIVATAHTGNWDLIACAVASRVPLRVVSKRLRVGWLDALWQGLRRRRGVIIVDATAAVAAAREASGQGGLVAMIIDQAPERRHGVMRAPFLGLEAWHDLAPALVAARLGLPLLLALGHRCPDGRHEVDVPLCMEPPDKAARPWAERATRELVVALEAHVRAWPAQWLWLHRRWKPLAPRQG